MPSNDTMGTLENVLRIFRIIQTDHYVTRKRLADELGVHPRTIKRYLETLDKAGFHLSTDTNGNIRGRISFDPETKAKSPMELFSLTREELIWLYLQLSGVHHAAPEGMKDQLWGRIRNALEGESLRGPSLDHMLTRFDKGYKSYETDEMREVIGTLLEALYRNQRCEMTYLTPGAR